MQKKNKDNYPESISMEEYLIRRKKGREDALGKDNGMLPSGLPACIYNHIAFEETSFWFPIEEQGKGRFPVKEEPAFLFWLFLFLMYSLSVFRWCPVKDTIDDDVPVQHDRKENGAGY